jgi:hypothetical protein
LKWQPFFVPCMDMHGFLCLPNLLYNWMCALGLDF